jgi:peptidoglycan/LPS O-acetylase OafA/YrhL
VVERHVRAKSVITKGESAEALLDRQRQVASEHSESLLNRSGRTLDDLKNPTFTSFLDLARWVCAWIVFLAHLRNPLFMGFESVPAADRGVFVTLWYFVTGWYGEAVVVFFVLSGYLVGAVACAKSAVGRFQPVDYAIDRATRIILPFIPALFLTALFDWLGMTFFDVGFYSGVQPQIHAKLTGDAFVSFFTLDIFLKNLLMLQTIVSPAFGSNQPLWTISLEFWFYVTFGLFLTGISGVGKPWSWVVGAVGLALLLGGNFLMQMGLWLIGLGAGFVGRSRLERPLAACIALFASLCAFRLLKGAFGLGELVMLRNYLIALLFAWLLVSMRGARWSALEAVRPLNAIMASFSYSLYLIHFPLMLLVLGVLKSTGFFPGIAKGYTPSDRQGLFVYALTVIIVGCSAFWFSRATESQTPRVRKLLRRQLGQ